MTLEEYNNTLISLQERSVETLQIYYNALEEKYNGSNLEALYSWTVQTLADLADESQSIPDWKNDPLLRDAITMYIIQIKDTFEKNEGPVVKLLSNISWETSGGIALYRENRQLFSSYTMTLATTLAELDKTLEQTYQEFSKKYNIKNTSTWFQKN